MNPADNIETAISGLHLTTDAELDRRILEGAWAAFDAAVRGERGGLRRRLLTRRGVRLAAAAALLIAALLMVAMLWSNWAREKEEDIRRNRDMAQEDSRGGGLENEPNGAVKEPDLRGLLAAELRQADQMFAAGDVKGLVAMLSTGLAESRVAAAGYLGKMGDVSAIDALEAQGRQWEGDPAANPFMRAIEEIKKAIREEPNAPEAETKVKTGSSSAEAEFKGRGVLSGLVRDAETGGPIKDAVISVTGTSRREAVSDANGLYQFDSLEQAGLSGPANVRLSVDAEGYVGLTDYSEMPVIALGAGVQAVRHFELEPGCMVDVLVVDEEGEPVAGVDLIVNSLGSAMGREVCPRAETDSNGLATIGGIRPAETDFLITARHKDFAPKGHRIRLNDPGVIEFAELEMEEGAAVTGYAYYLDGVPAEGLNISAKPDWWHCLYVEPTAPVDANGLFTLPHVSAGLYSIHVHIKTGRSRSTSFVVSQASLPAATGSLLVTIPRKSPGSLVSISGKVIFVGGKRAQSVEVSTSTADGDYRSVHLDGNQDTFTIDSLEPGLYTLEFSGSDMERKLVRDVRAPSSDLVVELRYSAKPKLEGVVVDAKTGSAIEHFRARVRKLETLRGSNYVQQNRWVEFRDAEGRFGIEAVGPGVYQVQAAAAGFSWTWSGPINTDENEPVVIELGRGGAMKGRVVTAGGEAVGGAAVTSLSRASGSMPTEAEVFVSQDGSVLTDVNGEFLIEHLGGGAETIKVTREGYGFKVVRDIEIIDGRTTESVNVVLSKGCVVEGHVYDEQGRPEGGATLFFQDKGGYSSQDGEKAGRLGTAVTDSNGYYRVEGLPERLCYVKWSNEFQSLGVVARAFVPAEGAVLRLDFGGKPVLKGRLVVNGVAMANARMLLGDPENRHSSLFKCYGLSDEGGVFRFYGAPAGRYGIYYLRADKRNEWVLAGTVETGFEDAEIGSVGPHMARVVVSVEAEPNEALPEGIGVQLSESKAFWGPGIGSVRKPQRSGDPYVIDDVAAGEYVVVAVLLPGYVRILGDPVTLDGGQAEVGVSMTIPRCSSSVHGLLVTGSDVALFLWREDEKVVAYLNRAEDGTYNVQNLPAGRYFVGQRDYVLGKSISVMEFELSEGQSRNIDIDVTGAPKHEAAHVPVLVLVVGTDGVPISGVRVRLEGISGQVEPFKETSPGYLFIVTEPGEYTLRAVHPGYRDAVKQVTLRERQLAPGVMTDSPVIIRLDRQ